MKGPLPSGSCIANYAFYLCENLPSITIPDGVTSLGDGAFYDCTALAEVTLPSTLESIGSYVFWDCSSLTTITLPAGLQSLGNFVFHECSALTSITSLAVAPPTCTENAFETLETTLPVYVSGNGLEDYKAHDAWKRFDIRCNLPSNLTITNITSNSAVISWTPSGDEMLWSISIFDFGEGVWWDDFMVTQNPLTLAGLKPNNSYLIAVKAIFTSCSSGFTDYESFSTSPATGIGEITNDKPQTTNKFFRNGVLYIECNGKTYNAQGVVVREKRQ